MDHTYWHKQTSVKPLFPELLWSRPENKTFAGKLLIVGGNAYGFAAPAEAYAEAVKSGVGTARVLLPNSLQKTIGKVFEAGEFAPSTPSGSFNNQALDELIAMSGWSDGVLIAGDTGRNSETAVVFEKFLSNYPGLLTLTKDAVDYFTSTPQQILARADTTLVLSFAQLQKLAISAHFKSAFTFDMDFLRLIDTLHDWTITHQPTIVTKHLDTIFVASNGQVSSTKLAQEMPTWRVHTAAHTSVWWLQNTTKSFEAMTTAIAQL